MKVILTKDVARIGRKSEVKNVPDGHALNFLIPRGFAKPATSENIKNLEDKNRKQAAQEDTVKEQFKSSLSKLTEPVSLEVDANEKGHLFQGLKAKDIAAELNTISGVAIEEGYIELKNPLKEIGSYSINLKCKDLSGEITLEVIRK